MESTTSDPIEILLNTEDHDHRDELTKQWRDHKLAELNFVGVVGALLASCLTSTGSWPTVLPDESEAPWTVRACWYSGIVFSLTSVLIAAHQTIRLHRLSAHRDSLAHIRQIMSSNVRGHLKPRRLQVWAWQTSSYFLTLSAVALICGMFILIWSSTGTHAQIDSWWDGYAKVAATVTAMTLGSAALFSFFQISLYTTDAGGPVRI